MTDRAFKRIVYRIDQSAGRGTGEFKEVVGYAFETPNWPEFHACVRQGARLDSYVDGWIVDHFESGLAISEVGTLGSITDAPEEIAALLNKMGRKRVRKAIARYCK